MNSLGTTATSRDYGKTHLKSCLQFRRKNGTLSARAHLPEGRSPRAAGHGKTLILAVLLRGEPYPEEVESRLRSRYAVVSALGSAGYTADEGGDLRCLSSPSVTSRGFPFERFTHRSSNADNQPYRETLAALVAREWRDRNRILPENVVVVWVDERLLGETNARSKLLKFLNCFAKQLTKYVSAPHLAVLGPSSSDTLRALLCDEGDSSDDQCVDSNGVRTPIYSFASTVGACARRTQAGHRCLRKTSSSST